MKLCDRCLVGGCLLNYLGPACKSARKESCPEIKLNNAERIASLEAEELSEELAAAMKGLFEGGELSAESVRKWLEKECENL